MCTWKQLALWQRETDSSWWPAPAVHLFWSWQPQEGICFSWLAVRRRPSPRACSKSVLISWLWGSGRGGVILIRAASSSMNAAWCCSERSWRAVKMEVNGGKRCVLLIRFKLSISWFQWCRPALKLREVTSNLEIQETFNKVIWKLSSV